jgi:hypothetical protein
MYNNIDTLLVVAKYLENLDWINKIEIPYVIYDKSNTKYHNKCLNILKIPNIGYEEYVYLKFIVDNYYSLPKRVIFCQGSPLDHTINFLKVISKTYILEYNEVQPLSSYWADYLPGEILTSISQNIKEIQVKDSVFHIDFFNGLNERLDIKRNIFERFPQKQQSILYEILKKFFKNEDIRQSMSNLIKLPLRQFDQLEITPMCYAATFSVTKEKILEHKKSYYEFLLDLDIKLSKNFNFPQSKMFGWVMEYMWLELFRYEPPKILYNHEVYKNKGMVLNNINTDFFKSRKDYNKYCNFSKCYKERKTIIYCCDYCGYKISEFEFINKINTKRKCFSGQKLKL